MRRPAFLLVLILGLALAACTSRLREEWDNALGIGLPSSAEVESVDVLRYGDVLAVARVPKGEFPAFSESVPNFAPWAPVVTGFSLPVGDRAERVVPETCTLYTRRRQSSGKELYLLWDEKRETVRAVLFQP